MRIVPVIAENKKLFIALLIISSILTFSTVNMPKTIFTAYVYAEQCPSAVYLNDPFLISAYSSNIAVEVPDSKAQGVFLVKAFSSKGSLDAASDLKKYTENIKKWKPDIKFSEVRMTYPYVVKTNLSSIFGTACMYFVLSVLICWMWGNRIPFFYEDPPEIS